MVLTLAFGFVLAAGGTAAPSNVAAQQNRVNAFSPQLLSNELAAQGQHGGEHGRRHSIRELQPRRAAAGDISVNNPGGRVGAPSSVWSVRFFG